MSPIIKEIYRNIQNCPVSTYIIIFCLLNVPSLSTAHDPIGAVETVSTYIIIPQKLKASSYERSQFVPSFYRRRLYDEDFRSSSSNRKRNAPVSWVTKFNCYFFNDTRFCAQKSSSWFKQNVSLLMWQLAFEGRTMMMRSLEVVSMSHNLNSNLFTGVRNGNHHHHHISSLVVVVVVNDDTFRQNKDGTFCVVIANIFFV